MAVATKTAARPAARALPKRQGSELQTFTWVGKDKRGTVMKGEQLAKNANLLKAELRRQGITPGTVKPKAKPLFGKAGSSISAKDIAMFSRQIATMMKSGVPVVQSFEIIAGGQTTRA
jgi:type IV pilus assembly protein PilC